MRLNRKYRLCISAGAALKRLRNRVTHACADCTRGATALRAYLARCRKRVLETSTAAASSSGGARTLSSAGGAHKRRAWRGAAYRGCIAVRLRRNGAGLRLVAAARRGIGAGQSCWLTPA